MSCLLLVGLGISFADLASSLPSSPSRLFHIRFTTPRLAPFTTLSQILAHESHSTRQAFSPPHFCTHTAFMFRSTSYSPVDLGFLFTRLTSFETSIIIIVPYNHFTSFLPDHGKRVTSLVRPPHFWTPYGSPFDLHLRWIPNRAHVHFHQFTSLTPSFFHLHDRMRILPRILLYETIKIAPGCGSAHSDMEPKLLPFTLGPHRSRQAR